LKDPIDYTPKISFSYFKLCPLIKLNCKGSDKLKISNQKISVSEKID
jgi:hypothetical protein